MYLGVEGRHNTRGRIRWHILPTWVEFSLWSISGDTVAKSRVLSLERTGQVLAPSVPAALRELVKVKGHV